MVSIGKFSIVVVAAVLAVSAAFAQAGKDQGKTVVITSPQVSCPVALQAQHAPGLTAQIPVDKNGSVAGQPTRHEGQHLQLTLNNPKMSAITAVRIRLRGWKASARTMPAQKASGDYSNASQVRDLKVNIDPRGSAKTDVWVSGMTAVNSIDLIGVSYADGSSWKPARLQVCSIMPALTMLISSNR